MRDTKEISIEEPNILEAFFEFIDTFGAIPKNAIIQAYQQEMPHALQEIDIDTEEKLDYSYALISLVDVENCGSQISEITSEDIDVSTTIRMQKAIVEIEIFSLVQFEMQRSIQLISNMFTHPRGIEFFNAQNISPLYVEKVQNTSSLAKENKYFSSKILCHCTYYSKIKEVIDSFSTVAVALQNTEVNYL